MFDILSPPPQFRPYKELFRCLVEMRILMQSEILPNKVEFHVHDVRTWLAVRGRWGGEPVGRRCGLAHGSAQIKGAALSHDAGMNCHHGLTLARHGLAAD